MIRPALLQIGSPTTLLQQIEEMRLQVNELASGEHKFFNGLNDALVYADYGLVHGVRNVATEHQLRRSMILDELRVLSLRIGGWILRRMLQ